MPDPQTITTLSLGTNALTAFELDPLSNYRVTCAGGYYVNIDDIAYVAADPDNYVHMPGGAQGYTLSTTGSQYQLAVIADAEGDAPPLALPIDDPAALLFKLEKFTPVSIIPGG
jgi:hypothetical protein